MTLREIQSEQEIWSQKNFKERHPEWAILGITEELGELSHAVLKQEQGIRQVKSEDEISLLETDAVGDIILFLMEFCNQRINEQPEDDCRKQKYDIHTIIEETWIKVRQRDWRKFPKNGTSE